MKRLSIVCLLLASSAMPAGAATLNFTGLALPTCALTVPIDGLITLQGDIQSWATVTPASITVVNTSPSTVTVTRPTNWASSPPGTPATTFSITGAMTGTNNGALTGNDDTRTGALATIGATIVSVSLGATAAAPFKAGAYTAQATVTCTVP